MLSKSILGIPSNAPRRWQGDVSSEASAGGFLQLHDGTLRRACEAAAGACGSLANFLRGAGYPLRETNIADWKIPHVQIGNTLSSKGEKNLLPNVSLPEGTLPGFEHHLQNGEKRMC